MRCYTFEKHDINEKRFDYEQRVINATDEQLVKNFFKCCTWVKENYPNLTSLFNTNHHVYHKLDVDITDGELTLCSGNHSAGYSNFINANGCAFYSQGSCQRSPYFFEGLYGFPNNYLIDFLEQWECIKRQIIATANLLNKVYSDNFTA